MHSRRMRVARHPVPERVERRCGRDHDAARVGHEVEVEGPLAV